MNKVHGFIKSFIEKEKHLEELFLQREISDHNELVEKICLLGIDELPLAQKVFEPLTMIQEMTIKANKDIEVKPRHLFKITEYENSENGKLWACYVSVANPITDEVKSIAFCFIVAKIEEELKMISLFFYDDMNDFMWKLGGGIRLNYYELGKVVAVERLLSPLVDEWSLKEYMLDR